MECCAICQDELGAARVTTSCNHAYHLRCLSEWYAKQGKGSCPLCRKEAAELDSLATPAIRAITIVDDAEDDEDEVFEYLEAEYPAPSLVRIMFLDAGEYVRDMAPPYTLAKVKNTLEAWVEEEEEEGRAEETQWHAYKKAIEGLERWQRLQESTPQTLTAN